MAHKLEPTGGKAAGQTFYISDRIQTILDANPHRKLFEGNYGDILISVAAKYPNQETLRLFDDNPASKELTQRFINETDWGTKFLAEISPTIKQQIVQKASENPDIVQSILEELLEESITNSVELTQYLIKHAQQNPEEVREIITITIDSGLI